MAGDPPLQRSTGLCRGAARRHRARHAHRHGDPLLHSLRRAAQVVVEATAAARPMSGRPTNHVEDPTIEQLADVAGRTDEVAVRRQLFGWRELVSTAIPFALIAVFARNVDWSEALGTIRSSNLILVGFA